MQGRDHLVSIKPAVNPQSSSSASYRAINHTIHINLSKSIPYHSKVNLDMKLLFLSMAALAAASPLGDIIYINSAPAASKNDFHSKQDDICWRACFGDEPDCPSNAVCCPIPKNPQSSHDSPHQSRQLIRVYSIQRSLGLISCPKSYSTVVCVLMPQEGMLDLLL